MPTPVPPEGTDPCAAQTGSGTSSSPYTFVMNGDFYWMLSSGSGYWRNPATHNLEVLSVNRPRSFNLSAYVGRTITLKFTGAEDYTRQTSFVIDDTALS